MDPSAYQHEEVDEKDLVLEPSTKIPSAPKLKQPRKTKSARQDLFAADFTKRKEGLANIKEAFSRIHEFWAAKDRVTDKDGNYGVKLLKGDFEAFIQADGSKYTFGDVLERLPHYVLRVFGSRSGASFGLAVLAGSTIHQGPGQQTHSISFPFCVWLAPSRPPNTPVPARLWPGLFNLGSPSLCLPFRAQSSVRGTVG